MIKETRALHTQIPSQAHNLSSRESLAAKDRCRKDKDDYRSLLASTPHRMR